MTIDLEEKRLLFADLSRRVREEYETLWAAQRTTREAATHEEARPENDKDTRALEQSYLARGQAERVASLKTDVDALTNLTVRCFGPDDNVALGAFVVVEDHDENEKRFLLAPAGAGELLDSSRGEVKVVTMKSPLGKALLGRQVGEDVELQSPSGLRVMSIVALS